MNLNDDEQVVIFNLVLMLIAFGLVAVLIYLN